ncbi:MAG: cobalt ECF transporter T component CbiQ [Thermodesulfovibrionales bacterium]
MELISEYFKKESLLLRVDARIKLLVALVMLAMVLSYNGFLFPMIILGISLTICIWLNVPLKVFFLRFSEPLFIAFVVIFLKFLFSGQDTMFSINLPTPHFALITLTGHMDGLIEGLQIGSRILGAVSIVTLLGLFTRFTEIMAALSWFKIPKGFIEISLFAYRYIFVIFEEAMVIYNAQKNRLGYSSIKRGLNSFGTLTGSLILKAFEHSQNTTVSMIQRGYDGNIPILKHKPFRVSEIIASAAIITAMGVVWKI